MMINTAHMSPSTLPTGRTSKCRANSYKRPGPVPNPAPDPVHSLHPSSTDPKSKFPLHSCPEARSHPQTLEPMDPYPTLRLLSQASIPSSVFDHAGLVFVWRVIILAYSYEDYDVTSSSKSVYAT